MLNEKQQLAYDQFAEFMQDPNKTLFALFGAAGTGKSYTSGQLLPLIRPRHKQIFQGFDGREVFMPDFEERLFLAPTWKAARIQGDFLQDNGLGDFEISFDAYMHRQGTPILTTTAQALGLQPVIKEDQTADKVSFGKVGAGLMRRLKPAFIHIDEVSMLSWQSLKELITAAQSVGTKVLITGDPNQLPPVNAQEIKWDKITNKVELDQIMRQTGDSAIPYFGRAVLDSEEWASMRGAGLRSVSNAAAAFLQDVGVPTWHEGERDVYVAYRNRTVDNVQEAAAHKVYGHSANEFAKGEIVIAQTPLNVGNKMVVAAQDQLEILKFGERGEWGVEVLFRNRAGRTVSAEYLTGTEMNDNRHPWVAHLNDLRDNALRLQRKHNAAPGESRQNGTDQERRDAWRRFFSHKDTSVINFAHPFAITSHKSQGSTYRRTYIAAQELAQFSNRSLYVAATRPSEELVF